MHWNSGSVVLASTGQVITGDISVDASTGIVLLKTRKNQVDVLPAHKVQQVHFYDHDCNINRRYSTRTHGRISQLYEVILTGPVSVIRLPRSRRVNSIADISDYRYFIMFQGKEYSLLDFSRRIYPALKINSPVLSVFIEEERLNINQRADVVRAIRFYNKVAMSAPDLASR